MPGYIKIFGRTRRFPTAPWGNVVCYVSFDDAKEHRTIVENSFRNHLSLDVDETQQHYPGHFTDLHNVARAILLYHYFRVQHSWFEDDRFEYIGPQHLPPEPPTAQGVGFKLWVSNVP